LKKTLFVLFLSLLLVGCGSNDADVEDSNAGYTEKVEKHDEMLDSGVEYYLTLMTSKYSSAYNASLTNEDKMKHLNEAITDINIAVLEIEDEYEKGVAPTAELLKLADALLLTIENEMLSDSEGTYDSSRDAGVIIGDLSREYLDGELPIGIQVMTGKDNADD